MILSMLVVSVFAVTAPVASAQSSGTAIAISNVTASTQTPTAGEPFSLRVTISNYPNSQRTANLNDLTVEVDGNREHIVNGLGQLTPGSQMTVSVPVTINDPEQKTISLKLYGSTSGTVINVQSQYVVDVREPQRPSLGIAVTEPKTGDTGGVTVSNPVVGATRQVNVTVANGNTESLRNVQLRLDGDADIKNSRRISASIASGDQTSHTYRVRFSRSGQQSLNATLTYDTPSGKTRTVSQVDTVNVDAATSDVTLDVSNRIRNDSSVILTELHQFGNVELEDVQIRAVNDGRTFVRVPISNVPGEGSRNATLDDNDIPAGNITIVATFTAGTDRQTIQQSLRYSKYSPAPTSAIALTDVGITRSGGTLIINGEAANVGTAQVNSVLISAANTDGVTPVGPTKEYFIDNIDSNEFEMFEATVNASSNLDQIPIQVEYTINGQRVSSTLPVDIGTIESQSDSNQEGGSPLLAIGLLMIVVVGAGIGVYRWRN
ncbi:hypothetical protein PM038_17790 [Halorubrum ezzemoulense]|uniref:hypothetical protein n=1 Tax=Halorubrum ezzemoulense TaxID=337243 RepID=UPI00232F3150|nr:hypothetical protein [Halorubrum ezzemoulense]MDB2287072.1 hypothetical protein [Halorubrum ezzemoulense]